MEVAAQHDGVEQEHEPEPVEDLPFADDVADDIAVEAIEAPAAPAPSETRRGRKFKPKGMFLGRRRDNDEPVDIKSTVLARHAAMLGSTGSGKTVMAKALIEERRLQAFPLIIDPQGDLARLALGGDASTIEAKGEDAARMRKLMDSTEVRIWTPLRSKGLPLCIDPFHAPPADLDPEEAITAWDMVAAGSPAWPDTTSRRRRARRSNPTCTKCSSKARVLGWTWRTSNRCRAWCANPTTPSFGTCIPSASQSLTRNSKGKRLNCRRGRWSPATTG